MSDEQQIEAAITAYRERMRAAAQIGLVQLDQGMPAAAAATLVQALQLFERLESQPTPA